MNGLIIAGTGVRRDAQGRYSLNDLHQAAGGEKRHGPSYWLATQQAQDLIAAMSDTGNPVSATRGGNEQGTYVAEPLVVAYAAWISPQFHLEVIRTFLAVKKAAVRHASEQGITGPIAREYRALLSIAKLTGLKGNQAILAAAQGTEKLMGTNPLQLIGQVHLLAVEQARHCTPTELGKELGESAQAFNRRLHKAGLQAKDARGHWQPTAAGAPFAVLMDTGKRHSDGAPVQQLKWLESVVAHLTDPKAA